MSLATSRRVRRQRFVTLLLFILGALCGSSIAQLTITFPDSATAPQSKEPQVKGLLSVNDVIKLSQAGLSDDVIVAQIRKRPSHSNFQQTNLYNSKPLTLVIGSLT